MIDKKSDVFKDNTVDKNQRANTSPPGPPDSGDPDFQATPHRRSHGFSSTPGAGPNPSESSSSDSENGDVRPTRPRSPGFSNTPGAGPNPTAPDNDAP